jgi:phenylacetate-CoA ligase
MDARVTADPSDDDRYPTLTEHGRRMLRFLREHPHAPLFRNESGNRLASADLERVRQFERATLDAPFDWQPGRPPAWAGALVARCHEEVPFYRRQGSAPPRLEDVPSVSRSDLARDIAQFVPDSAPVDRLINFRTTGTTGYPLLLASHPVVAASYLAFHKRALRRFGIELAFGRGQVGIVLLGFQRHCFTYVSVTPTMDESGLAKINLHPGDWRDPADRARYLDALSPEVYAGDPISFAELLTLPLGSRPRALLSTSMALTPHVRERLEQRFACPVLDLYSLNEAGPIAVADPALGGHVLLQPGMYVEILGRDDDRPVPPGTAGEITLTGGFNFCLPLLRYRTGDHGLLVMAGNEMMILDLAGRPPVRFRTTTGGWINNIDVTHVLAGFPLIQYSLHQSPDGSLDFRFQGPLAREEELRKALQALFGPTQSLQIGEIVHSDRKVVQYTSDVAGSTP